MDKKIVYAALYYIYFFYYFFFLILFIYFFVVAFSGIKYLAWYIVLFIPSSSGAKQYVIKEGQGSLQVQINNVSVSFIQLTYVCFSKRIQLLICCFCFFKSNIWNCLKCLHFLCTVQKSSIFGGFLSKFQRPNVYLNVMLIMKGQR